MSRRKTERNLHARVVHRLVFHFGMSRKEVARVFDVDPVTITHWLRPWCVIFPVRGAPFVGSIIQAR